MMDIQKLIQEAIAAQELSYSPYSNFRVGAALLTAEGKVYSGCNIENAAFGPGNCAERTAFFKAVSAGERDFEAIAVAGWPKDGEPGYAYPCGVCRQVMAEFCKSGFRIIVAKSPEEYSVHTLEGLLPHRFGPEDLK